MANPLFPLYEKHVLGDGHGFAQGTELAQEAPAQEPPKVESAVQRRKRLNVHRAQKAEIDQKIAQFRALDDDW